MRREASAHSTGPEHTESQLLHCRHGPPTGYLFPLSGHPLQADLSGAAKGGAMTVGPDGWAFPGLPGIPRVHSSVPRP